MRIDYSKPSADIEKESLSRIENDKALFVEQKQTSAILHQAEKRKNCILCLNQLHQSHFLHRGLPYFQCEACGHIQAFFKPPEGYPQAFQKSFGFSKIYPELSFEAYQDRKQRIYEPKFNWAMNCLKDAGFEREELQNKRWVEIGCGAGYFLAVLEQNSISDFAGVDLEEPLIKQANHFLEKERAFVYKGALNQIFKHFPAQVYAAFFVLEHIEDTHAFVQQLNEVEKNTIFIFSVPVFGFSCLIEQAFENYYARNLDSVLHTQLYTDESIHYLMGKSGFEILGQWIFGQDATDMIRILYQILQKNFQPSAIKDQLEQKILKLSDSFQSTLDHLLLSDQRHVIAIKK